MWPCLCLLPGDVHLHAGGAVLEASRGVQCVINELLDLKTARVKSWHVMISSYDVSWRFPHHLCESSWGGREAEQLHVVCYERQAPCAGRIR